MVSHMRRCASLASRAHVVVDGGDARLMQCNVALTIQDFLQTRQLCCCRYSILGGQGKASAAPPAGAAAAAVHPQLQQPAAPAARSSLSGRLSIEAGLSRLSLGFNSALQRFGLRCAAPYLYNSTASGHTIAAASWLADVDVEAGVQYGAGAACANNWLTTRCRSSGVGTQPEGTAEEAAQLPGEMVASMLVCTSGLPCCPRRAP